MNHKYLALVLLLPFILFVTIKCDANSLMNTNNSDFIDDEDSNNDDGNESRDFKFTDEKKKDKNNDDFDREIKQIYASWMHEDLCKEVKCKQNHYCVIKSQGVAVCVKRKKEKAAQQPVVEVMNAPKSNSWNKKMLNDKNNDDDDDEDDDDYNEEVNEKSKYAKIDDNKLKLCTPCPVIKPQFICGSDNSTYSSLCRINFHNCVHKTNVKFACNGFCPCAKSRKSSKAEKSSKHNLKSKKHSYNNKNKQEKKNHLMEKFRKNMLNFKKDIFKVENKQKIHNSVLPKVPTTKSDNKKCLPEDLKIMGSRLLDWFSVVIADQKGKHIESKKSAASKIPDCQKEVAWMFHHFDTNDDYRLSLKELYYLEHDEREQCLQPYLSQCDEDNDDFLSPYEWCTCFDKKSQPCSSALQHTKKGLLGAYTPQCDIDGFYKPMQCHSSTGVCWCVDKNGVEFMNTRRKGVPDCKGLLNRARQRNKMDDVDADDDDDDDDDDDGSGDGIINS